MFGSKKTNFNVIARREKQTVTLNDKENVYQMDLRKDFGAYVYVLLLLIVIAKKSKRRLLTL